jgi:hypothetical protein
MLLEDYGFIGDSEAAADLASFSAAEVDAIAPSAPEAVAVVAAGTYCTSAGAGLGSVPRARTAH